MDPNNQQQQLTDNEQMILGAQQAALLQQMHDKEIETKAIQQQHLIQEEKILEAQTEALAIQQMQQVQEMEEQRHEAELHHLQTMAIIEQEKEVMMQQQQAQQQLQQQQPPPQPVLEGAVLAVPGQPPVIAAPVTPILVPQAPPGAMPPPAPQPILSQPPPQQPPPAVAFPGPPPPLSTANPIVTIPPDPVVQQQAPISMGVPPQGQQPQQQLITPSSGPTPLMSIPHINPTTTISQGPPPPIAQALPSAPVLAAPTQAPPGSTASMGPGSFGSQPVTAAGPPPLMSQPIPPHVVTQTIQLSESQGSEEESTEPRIREEEPAPPQKAPAGPVPAAPTAKSLAQREIKLPQALEKVLAFKGIRAEQMGVKPEDVERVEKGGNFPEGGNEEEDGSIQVFEYERNVPRQEISTYPEYAEEEEEAGQKDDSSKKESKNKKRKKKKKRAKARKLEQQQQQPISMLEKDMDEDVEVEYVQEDIDIERTDPSYAEFSRIFQAFKIAEENKQEDAEKSKKIPIKEVPIKARGLIEDDDDDDDDIQQSADDDKPKLSKKKMKKMNRLSVAELKQLVARPDVVEMHDVTARDPKLLVHIKATRNSVPVPRHWCFKRKYLQGKRGIEKPPFDLPHFIKATGIMEMRQALQEKEDQKTLKSKMRERVRPKMGKIDIDYQKLHDAFFKWQTKPKLSIHGDLYYEGKEFETRLKEKKPGNLTDELRTSLGMPIGGGADKYPPPWLIAQQRYGPPPSYPNLKIPGLNAPIPDGCAFGYHAGGWGKPPVDEAGKPLYGDVFGTQTINIEAPVQDEDIDKSRWGELESESEEEEESEEEQEEEEVDATGLVTPGDAGLITPSGVTSVPVGMETPDMIELRKRRIEDAMDQGGDTPALYQVLPEKKSSVGGAMMGSAHVYDISAAVSGAKKTTEGKSGPDGVEVALNPDELDLDTAAMQAKYEQTVREQQSQLEKEDLSDMVAEHAAKQQKKRKKQAQDGKSTKKYKEFKF